MLKSDLSPSLAARESRARRAAERCGLTVSKSRRAPDGGYYALIDVDTNAVAYGTGPLGYDATLDDIEKYLAPG